MKKVIAAIGILMFASLVLCCGLAFLGGLAGTDSSTTETANVDEEISSAQRTDAPAEQTTAASRSTSLAAIVETQAAKRTNAKSDKTRCKTFESARLTLTPEDLISDADTGARKVQGEILGAAVVKSNETVAADSPFNAGLPINFVAVNVDGKVILLAHPEGGLWLAVDQFSSDATGFPFNPSAPAHKFFKARVGTDGASLARDCAMEGFGAEE